MMHYQNTLRWDRLCKNSVWIYHDLYFIFNKWDRVYSAAKSNHNLKTLVYIPPGLRHPKTDIFKDVLARQPTRSILEQTRELHIDSNTIMSLRELLRIHIESLNVVKHALTRHQIQKLAFIFLPLSFVAVSKPTIIPFFSYAVDAHQLKRSQAIFSIPTLNVSARYYPAVAIPVLLATLTIAYTVNNLIFASSGKPSSRSSSPSLLDTLRALVTGSRANRPHQSEDNRYSLVSNPVARHEPYVAVSLPSYLPNVQLDGPSNMSSGPSQIPNVRWWG
jgi:hypothetical protein